MLIDLSHDIEAGMTTYNGLPGPKICDYWTRESTRGNYDDGSSFQIGRLEMVGNTGTYIDSPFHRYEHGRDLAGLPLDSLANLQTVLVHAPAERGLSVDVDAFSGLAVKGKAVLVATGWDRHWRTDTYHREHPFLTKAAAEFLAGEGAKLVGIDSHNIDDARGRSRPVHSILLGADIPICEHLCNLAAIGKGQIRFSAVPPKIVGFGTFPVRAFAEVY